MKAFFRSASRLIRDHSTFLAATFALVATYLASYVALIPPEKRSVPSWLVIFASLCSLAFVASLIQQRVANTLTKNAEALELRQTEMLERIVVAVGAGQAQIASATAEGTRQLVEVRVEGAKDSRPIVIIRYDVDGEKEPRAQLEIENFGDLPALNVRIEDVSVPGNRGRGTWEQVPILTRGEKRHVTFDAPDEGLVFRDHIIMYFNQGLKERRFNWDAIKTQADARELFAPMRLPLTVIYDDPNGKRYRSEHELEFTFSKHATVIFRKQVEIAKK